MPKKYIFRYKTSVKTARAHLDQFAFYRKWQGLQIKQNRTTTKLTLGYSIRTRGIFGFNTNFRNSFYPIFVGKWKRINSGAQLEGYFRINLFIACFLILFFAVIILNLLSTLSEPDVIPDHQGNWGEQKIRFYLLMICFMTGMTSLGWFMGRTQRREILEAIEESTQLIDYSKPIQIVTESDSRSSSGSRSPQP